LFSGISYEDTDGIGVFNGFLCINIVPVFYVIEILNIRRCILFIERAVTGYMLQGGKYRLLRSGGHVVCKTLQPET
jgi:hypothetical protein